MNFNVLDLKVPFTDFKVNVNSVFKEKWQAQWNACPENKLFQINPTVGSFLRWTGLSRREEIVITRARIGHSYFSHSFLLKREDMPWCIPCHCPYTVKHVLLECQDLAHIHVRYLRGNLTEILSSNLCSLFKYLKEINLFYKI